MREAYCHEFGFLALSLSMVDELVDPYQTLNLTLVEDEIIDFEPQVGEDVNA